MLVTSPLGDWSRGPRNKSFRGPRNKSFLKRYHCELLSTEQAVEFLQLLTPSL
uniref:Uncharacterized protein n=1 Tax=Arundo donax TaxID=35708 RepID=A0A0A9B2Z4_ARUDO